jgi:hypothetical protein
MINVIFPEPAFRFKKENDIEFVFDTISQTVVGIGMKRSG